jgi:hypothetical protein
MFLNSIMLAGLGAAALPLMLHLLSRARYRSVDWGAMMFLSGADSRQRQSTQVKQWILLLMRMATVGLLAVALARPIVRGDWARLTEQGAVTAVIAIDCSSSMAYSENGVTRFDQARRAVSQILSNLRPGDRAVLMLIGIEQADEELRPTADLRELEQRLLTISPSTGHADYSTALTRAAELFERDSDSNRELYLITDAQAVSWNGIDSNFESAWKARARSSSPVRFVVVAIGNTDRDNVAVESMQILNPPVIRQQSAQIDVRVRNYGDVPRTAWPLRVMRGDVELLRTTVNLAPDGTANVRLPITFDASGPQVVTATVDSAGIPADDALSIIANVIEPIRILMVSGDERDEPFRSESGFVRAALSPYQTSGQPGSDLAALEVVSADKWNEIDVDAYQVIILANVSQFTDVQAKSIEQFILAGGGVLIAPGNLSRLQNYNELLGGVLPGLLEVSLPDTPTSRIAMLDRAHPVFRFMREGTGGLPNASIAKYVGVRPREQHVRILASLRGGAPLLLESLPGEGRVLLFTSTVDADWNALPLSNFYLPMMQSAIRFLAGDSSEKLNLSPDETLAWNLETIDVGQSPTVVGPDGNRHPVEQRQSGVQSEARFDQTHLPGLYKLEVAGAAVPVVVPFVVRPLTDESDLTPLNSAQWDRLEAGLDFERAAPDANSLTTATSGARALRELWLILLVIVAAMAIAELMLARIWSEERS